MKILITGCAGFIGYHAAARFVESGVEVVGLDNINDYYDTELKYSRLEQLGINRKSVIDNLEIHSTKFKNLVFLKADLVESNFIKAVFDKFKFDIVLHLAAQAGVRYSLTNPQAYIDANLTGFLNILEASQKNNIKHLIYASSSSVYGLNTEMPFSEEQDVSKPVSLYAASKRANELMAHAYSHLYSLPSTGLRFFTVYGPWGRPDMALFKFVKAIKENSSLDVYNFGEMRRDFTYVDDIIESIYRLACKEFTQANRNRFSTPYNIFNIGNSSPHRLMDFIKCIEVKYGKKANVNFMPIQPGDVPETWADCSLLEAYINFRPSTSIEEGVSNFIDWYDSYYKSNG
jgi:UDP-glucuronate 4-epimerase